MGKWFGLIAAFLLVLPGCGSNETPTRQNDFTPLTSIVISTTVDTLPVGVSTQLTATGNFSGLYTRDITDEVTWSSAQTDVADFPNDLPLGRIRAVGPGTATISVTSAEGLTSSFNLTVNDAVITDLTIAPLLPSLPMGKTQAFTAQGTFSGEQLPRDLTKDVTWSSSEETIATMSDAFASKGVAKALKMGSTNITATFIGTSTHVETTTLTVTEASLSSIAITPANPSLLSLTTQSFTATGTFSDGTSRPITTDTGISWASSNPTVATASANSVTALTPGTSTITATDGTVSGTSVLKVTGGNLTEISLTLDQAVNNALIKDTISRITARGIFDNGTSRDITGLIETWTVVDNTKASFVDDVGNLEWVKALAVTPFSTLATLSATYGSVTGQSTVNISAPSLPSVSIPTPPLTLAIGTSGRLSMTGTFSSGNQDLTPTAEWSSATAATATVGNIGLDKGRVKALAAGPAVITATYGVQTPETTVTVVAKTLESLTIAAASTPATMIAGTEKQFTVTALYTDGFEQDVTEDAVWTISDSNVAKFSDSIADPGLVVAVDAGTATVTASFDTKIATENITVSQ